MAEVQRTTTPGRPWHLWLIGIVTVFPVIFAAFLTYYARVMSKKGVLS